MLLAAESHQLPMIDTMMIDHHYLNKYNHKTKYSHLWRLFVLLELGRGGGEWFFKEVWLRVACELLMVVLGPKEIGLMLYPDCPCIIHILNTIPLLLTDYASFILTVILPIIYHDIIVMWHPTFSSRNTLPKNAKSCEFASMNMLII